MWDSYANAYCGNIPRDLTCIVLPKLKLAKFLDHGVVHEDLASDLVPTAMSNSCYQILLGKG